MVCFEVECVTTQFMLNYYLQTLDYFVSDFDFFQQELTLVGDLVDMSELFRGLLSIEVLSVEAVSGRVIVTHF